MLKRPLLLLTITYLLFRLPFLTRLPIFIDEATFIDWGWRTIHLSHYFYFPLVFSKMPLLMWIFGICQSFISDPLIAGRLVSILTGWTLLIGLFYLSRLFFNFRTSFLASILYILVPIFVFFDRQALMESAIGSVGIWSCYFLTRLLDKPQIKWSCLLGLTLGLGYLIKASGLIFIPPVIIIILFRAWRSPSIRFSLITYLIFIFLFFVITISPVLFQPEFWKTARDIFYFSLTPKEFTGLPIIFWGKNLIAHLDIAFWHLTPLILLAAVLGFKNVSPLAPWTLLTIVITTLATRDATIRYLTPYLPPLLIFAAHWLSTRTKLFPLFIIPCLIFSFSLIVYPPTYFRLLSRVTRYSHLVGYLLGRDTGYQAMATINYLKDHLPASPTYIGVAANAGNPEQAVFSYLRRRPNTILGYLDDHVLTLPLDQYDCLTASIPVFYVARHQEQGGLHHFYTPVATVTNSQNSDYNTIYTLKSPCTGQTLSIDPVINYYRQVLN